MWDVQQRPFELARPSASSYARALSTGERPLLGASDELSNGVSRCRHPEILNHCVTSLLDSGSLGHAKSAQGHSKCSEVFCLRFGVSVLPVR